MSAQREATTVHREATAWSASLVELATAGSLLDAEPAELIALAAVAVPAADHACLTVVDVHERVRRLACSASEADELDGMQSALREGPAFDVVESVRVVSHSDLSVDPVWPRFASAATAHGVRSLLSVQVPVEGIGTAALTFYAAAAAAFGEIDHEVATVCGSLLGLVLRSARERERAENLQIALETNRQIAIAIGILMARATLSADQAFDQLRTASQRLNRKLRDVAEDVVITGILPGT